MAEIPTDLHPSILKILPPKSLLKSLSVSKSWYSIIKSPSFITSYYNHRKSANHNNQVFLLKVQSRCFIFRYHDPPGTRRIKLRGLPSAFDNIAASLDDLVCLSGSNHSSFLLWNPSLDKFKTLEPPWTVLPGSRRVLGLGCNHVVGGYKLVLLQYSEMNSLFGGDDYIPHAHAQVYSVYDNPCSEWKNVPLPDIGFDSISRLSNACFVNEMIYWIVFRGEYDEAFELVEFGASLLTFDTRNDCFAEMQLPMELRREINPDLHLAVVGDSLGLVHFPRGEQVGPSAVVWELEVYGVELSWKVLYKVNLSSVTKKRFWAQEDGKLFITTSSGKLLVIFGVKNGKSGVYNGDLGMIGGEAYSYTESLQFLDGLQREQLKA